MSFLATHSPPAAPAPAPGPDLALQLLPLVEHRAPLVSASCSAPPAEAAQPTRPVAGLTPSEGDPLTRPDLVSSSSSVTDSSHGSTHGKTHTTAEAVSVSAIQSTVGDSDVCPPTAVCVVLGLHDVCVHSEQCNAAGALCPFASRTIPPVPTLDYVARIAHRARIPDDVVTAAVVLALRWQLTVQPVTPYTVHRLLAACVLVAAKALTDFFLSNEHFADLAGVSAEELLRLETTLLSDLSFDVVVSSEEVRRVGEFAAAAWRRTPGVDAAAMATRGSSLSAALPFLIQEPKRF